MPIFELMPIDLGHINWRASMVWDQAVIRAEHEMDARLLAANTFQVAATRAVGEQVPIPPWTDPALVDCRELDDTEWEADGPPAVLFPEGFS